MSPVNRRSTIVVVDDEPRIRRFVRTALEADGYRVQVADCGAAGLQLAETAAPALMVIDLMLPDIDGFEVIQRLRQTSNVPVIVLSARGSNTDKVRGLDLGADDYVTKPFNTEELSARVRALLRRVGPMDDSSHEALAAGPIRMDPERRRVHVCDREVHLSPTEWRLLYQLMANVGRVLLHEDLLTKTWGPEYRNDLQYLRVWISRVRHKLGDSKSMSPWIQTVPGVGYTIPESL